MQIVYDYIVTTVIFFLIFSFSMASLLNIVETPMRHVSEQQLTTRAETVLGNLFGYMGDPANWGDNISFRPENLKSIGLSKNLKTDVIYDLDPSKLSRLLPIDTGASVHTDAIYKLLNLGREYRFSLHMVPVLNISVTPTGYLSDGGDTYATEFLVAVTTHERTPVGNVNLSVYIITAYIEMGSNRLIFDSNGTTYNVTRWDGNASFNFTSLYEYILDEYGSGNIKFVGSLLVVIGDFFGMHTMYVYPTSHTAEVCMQGIIVGHYLIFEDPDPPTRIPFEKGKNMTVANEYTFNDVILTGMTNSSAGTSFPWLAYHNGTQFQVYELAYLEPDIYGACIVAKSRGDYYLIIFPRIPNVIDFGERTIPRGTRVVGIRRLVFVEDMAFFADFFFWRTSD